ncbi:transglycosylase SLT domain-containing protein [Nocardioides sp. TRM66260-LWL]|uniref:endonuclease/exonuclease/phosphatase family protein n=1 Tax=Nocardioides sp. TRM66260-LWL TaxID=2874478 RepID=UPI001CC49FA1|nr:endonuclease/exonuclease/phosphatase family protein [Nocardioides sp. TRM66260-LWL]MBZ5735352.1 transglycosylase SLT domain-containing protein [Nocardioides sp. TRM66260-LWL]
MKKIALGLPLLLMAPLMLLFLGMGNANIAAVQAACATTATSTGGMFGIGTLNWRGASHYESNPHPGERPYRVRVPNMVAKVGASGASIIGFQEFEPPQAADFLNATHGAWAIVKGRAHGKPATANSIAYQPGVWTVAEVRYVTIKYGGPTVQIPLVRFTSTKGIGSIWVLNTHNPADVVNGSDAMRDDAVRAEANTLRQLQASEPTTPLFLTGDMNDKARFKNLFLTTAGSGWSSANTDGNQIDRIMGSAAVTFSGTVVDQSTNDNAHDYTDHPFVYTGAQLANGPSAGDNATSTGQAGTGTDLGVMPTSINATPGGPVNGNILIANANIKLRSGFTPGVRALAAPSPDFITLNEVGDVPIAQMQADAPGYGAYRDPTPVQAADGGARSLDNAIMWRTDTWKMLDGGRVRIVQDDHVIFHGSNKNWGRWAIWGVFQRTDGAVAAVISSHQMTNPFRYPNSQWGDQPFTRATQYGQGMDYLVQLTAKLSAYGPVFLGGDMNSHPGEGPESAAAKMQAAGFRYTKDSGVIYNFYAAPVSVEKTWEISKAAVHSDHPALFTRMAMNGAGPGGPTSGTGATGVENIATGTTCPPCPSTYGDAGSVVLQNVAATDSSSGAQVAAKAAYQAGFRGEDLVTAVAIAHVESNWNPNATNGTHFGLWQIAASHKGLVPGWNQPGDIFDPLVNARYAFALYSGRPGAGAAKFADWLPFEHADYHQYLDQARQGVAAAVGTGALTPVADTGGSCAASAITVAGDLSAALSARISAMQHTPGGLCGLSWTHGAPCTYSGQCPKVVDALYGGPGVGRGYGNGQDVAQGIINAGLAQARGTGLDPLPPVGAVVSYDRGDGVGHVAIYVGNGKIFGNDYGCSANGVYGCVGFADVHTPSGSVTWALPKAGFDLGGMPAAAA